MPTDENNPATRRDLKDLKDELTLVFDTKLEVVNDQLTMQMEQLTIQMSTIKDEIIRAFQVESEKISKHTAHVDEVADNRNRISRIEEHIGLEPR